MGRSTTQTVEAPQAPASARPLNENLCWLLSRASHSLTTELTAALEDLGLSPRGHAVLLAAMTGAHTQTELARAVGLDKTTMVVTLDELEAAGLAERRPSKVDRRARVIAVTPAGARKVAEAEEIGERIRADVLDALDPDDRDAFMRSLCRLAADRLAEPVRCSQPVRRRAPRR
jgi:MarR family transcriptional regulator, transcriptional regulator for hemolysin